MISSLSAKLFSKLATKPLDTAIGKIDNADVEIVKRIVIGEDAHRQAKTEASREGTTIREFIERLIREAISKK